MPTKALMPNQHTPLHFIYGHNDCCLCKAQAETERLKQLIRRIIPFLEQEECACGDKDCEERSQILNLFKEIQ